MKESIYPWHDKQWQQLRQRALDRRLPHGLLFSGPAGVGKRDFAEEFVRALLCTKPLGDGRACGQCPACQLVRAGTHPDYLKIQPGEDKSQILIDQIRDACATLALKSHAGGYKVAILQPAEQMNQASANSLLKTLEEPTDNTLLILISEQPSRLASTVRSRCQQLRFPTPRGDHVIAWLAERCPEHDAALLLRLADGAPLRARQFAEDGLLEDRRRWLEQLIGVRQGTLAPTVVAADWVADPALRPLYWVGSFASDVIKLHNQSLYSIKNSDLSDILNELLSSTSRQELHLILEQIWQGQRLALNSSVNRQLLVESILIQWSPTARVHSALA